MKTKALLSLALFVSALFYAQNYTVEVFDTANSGLLNNQVNSVEVDNLNNVWFSTSGSSGTGLGKLSGNQWTYYNTANSGIADNYIRQIEINSTNAIFAAHNNAISKFDGASWTVYNGVSNAGFDQGNIRDLVVTNNNHIWAIFEGNSYDVYYLLHFDGTSWEKLDQTNTPILSNLSFQSNFQKDELNRIFITQSSNTNLLIYDGTWSVKDLQAYGGGGLAIKNNIAYYNNSGNIYSMDLSTNAISNLSTNCISGGCDIRSINFDSVGEIWASDSGECGGGYVLSLNNCHIFKNSTYDVLPYYLSIYDFDIDSKDVVWAISGYGLIKITKGNVLGIDEVRKDALMVFPNPATTEINFDSVTNGSAEIYDFTGKLIKSEKLMKGRNSLNISNLQHGNYILKTPEGSTKFMKK